jgi:hypothetical protein
VHQRLAQREQLVLAELFVRPLAGGEGHHLPSRACCELQKG